MKIRLFLTAFTAFAVSTAVAQAQDATPAAEATVVKAKAEPQKAKPKKITDRNHPDYVRCRSEPIIGSLARKRRVCMTNREWVNANKVGSRKSRQFVEDMQVGENTSN